MDNLKIDDRVCIHCDISGFNGEKGTIISFEGTDTVRIKMDDGIIIRSRRKNVFKIVTVYVKATE
jgi:hypothetical protein